MAYRLLGRFSQDFLRLLGPFLHIAFGIHPYDFGHGRSSRLLRWFFFEAVLIQLVPGLLVPSNVELDAIALHKTRTRQYIAPFLRLVGHVGGQTIVAPLQLTRVAIGGVSSHTSQAIPSSTVRGQGREGQLIGGARAFEGRQDRFSASNGGRAGSSFVRNVHGIINLGLVVVIAVILGVVIVRSVIGIVRGGGGGGCRWWARNGMQ